MSRTPGAAGRPAGILVSEFKKVRQDPAAVLDEARFRQEVVGTVRSLVERHPAIRAIVLECTDLPPCSEAIRRELGLPVFDFVTLLHWVDSAT
jgi:Asp/Glu/hydantoin racemase